MVVQHNMQAMNANRMLASTSTSQAKSTEKLSSGYRINRAADDAAGLSISEKMRKQIRGLDQASANAQDGISCVQTAEGALTEVHSMLQRMNELAVQSANGTNSETDRQAIQDEIDQLAEEIDRVSETTKFNETYLLKGDPNATATNTDMQLAGTGEVTAAAQTVTEGVVAATGTLTLSDNAAFGEGSTDTVSVGGTTYNLADYADIDELADALSSNAAVAKAEVADKVITLTAAEEKEALSFNLHVGSESLTNNKIGIEIDSMSSAGLGIKGLKVTSEKVATDAIDVIAEAIQKVSSQRSALGAAQNRLEHTIANLDNVVENTTAAESAIRDTDMAEEMVEYSKNNILSQAGQSMLAQANQSTQGVLSLLQ